MTLSSIDAIPGSMTLRRFMMGVGLIVLSVSETEARADSKQFYFERFQRSQQTPMQVVPQNASVATLWFTQRLNPNSPTDTRTFQQRYYLDSRYASGPNAPVLFYICGEASCESGSITSGAVVAHARALQAHLIALEHRYYGKSQPFETLSPSNLQFLTTEYALKDLARFQEFAQKKYPLKGPWISIGGSYPGSLSAFYRLKYPQLVSGALASSAPVQAKENFEEYDLHVATVAGPECAADMRRAVAQAEATLNDPQKLLAAKRLFEAEEIEDPVDFLYLIADMGALAIQYGFGNRFCALLTQDSVDPLSGWAKFTREIFATWGLNALSTSPQGAMSEDPNDYMNAFGMRQWYYQSCTEYGFWQNAYHDTALSARSARINPAYHRGVCQRLFGINAPARTGLINQTYYEPLQDRTRASRILFTNGDTDPWSKLSITAPNGNPDITVFVIPGAAHCNDLGTERSGDSNGLRQARRLFLEVVADWGLALSWFKW